MLGYSVKLGLSLNVKGSELGLLATDNCTNKTTKLFFMLQPNLTNTTPNALVRAVIKNYYRYVIRYTYMTILYTLQALHQNYSLHRRTIVRLTTSAGLRFRRHYLTKRHDVT